MRQPWFPFLSFCTMANAGGAVRAHWTIIAAKRTGDLSRFTLATAWLLLACVCGQFAGLTQIIGYALDKVGAKLVQSVKSQDMTSSAWSTELRYNNGAQPEAGSSGPTDAALSAESILALRLIDLSVDSPFGRKLHW